MTYSFVFIYIFPPATGTQLGVGASLGATSTRDAAALNLAGCCYAGLGDRGTAATFFERAVIAAPYGNFFLFFFTSTSFWTLSRAPSPLLHFYAQGRREQRPKYRLFPSQGITKTLSHTHSRAVLSSSSLSPHTRRAVYFHLVPMRIGC